jgi:hypothetical protein
MQTLDTSSSAQRKCPHGNSRFNGHAGFGTQGDTSATNSLEICPPDFFLFGWLHGKLQQRPGCVNKLFTAVDEILTSLSVDTIEDVFRNWIHPLKRVIELNGDSVE